MRGGVWERGGAINRDVVKEREAVLGARRGVWERDAARHVATKNTVSIEVSIPLRILREKMPRSPRVHRP